MVLYLQGQQERERRTVAWLVVALLVLVVVLCSRVSFSEDRTMVNRIAIAIAMLTSETPRRDLHRNARKQDDLAWHLVRSAERWSVDPFLLLATAWKESGLRSNVVGARGELGVMQVNPKGIARVRSECRPCDFKTVQGQIDCGACWLRREIDRCGSVVGGSTAYIMAQGICDVHPKSKPYRAVSARLALAEQLRNETDD